MGVAPLAMATGADAAGSALVMEAGSDAASSPGLATTIAGKALPHQVVPSSGQGEMV